jgi:nitrite reductase/ring-hydroxylating ferredoxin subunit
MGRWVRAACLADIAPGTGRVVEADGRRLALFNDGGEFFAVDDSCPHQGASLGEGFLHRGSVVCPWHNWSFEIRTGLCPSAPHLKVACFPTRQVGDAVEIEVPDTPSEPGPAAQTSE